MKIYVLQQHRSRDTLALVTNKILENLKFSWQQVDFPATAARRIDTSRVRNHRPQHHFFDNAIAAPGESFNTGQQFREGKRLDEVVIAAGAQAAHPIINLAKSTDDEGGVRIPLPSSVG